MIDLQNVIDRLKEEEGFRGDVYKDVLGWDTVGYGTKLPLTQEEAEWLLKGRLQNMYWEACRRWDWLEEAPEQVQEVIADMVYNMGVGGVAGFKKMLGCMECGDWKGAIEELLDSRYARQLFRRSRRNAEKLGELLEVGAGGD